MSNPPFPLPLSWVPGFPGLDHAAFVLNCIVPFLSLLQAYLFWQLHKAAPGSGNDLGVFLRRHQQTGALEVHVRTPKSREEGGQVYRVVKHGAPESTRSLSRSSNNDYV